jgi:hypothetical protein
MKCAECGRELDRDECGLSYKLISRAATQLYCLDCLSRQFRISKDELLRLAEQFREAGCTLFL